MKGWQYDETKRLYSKHTSKCHDAPVVQKMLYLGKVVTDPNFKIVTKSNTLRKVKNITYKKLVWKLYFLITKVETIRDTQQSVKNVQFRYFCTKCDKQCKDNWEFKSRG